MSSWHLPRLFLPTRHLRRCGTSHVFHLPSRSPPRWCRTLERRGWRRTTGARWVLDDERVTKAGGRATKMSTRRPPEVPAFCDFFVILPELVQCPKPGEWSFDFLSRFLDASKSRSSMIQVWPPQFFLFLDLKHGER